MIKNISKKGSAFRILTGAALISLFVAHITTGVIGLTLFSLAGVLILSGIFRACPITYVAKRRRLRL